MSQRDNDHIRPQPGKPDRRSERFINKVLQQASKAGANALKTTRTKTGHPPGARLGRGHVAARFAGTGLVTNARRVAIKTRLVRLAKAGPRSTATHLRYIERDGVDRQGGAGRAYGPSTDAADLDAFQSRGDGDRHHFRFIVSPEDAEQLDDLRIYTRHLMARMEGDLGTRLDWVAVDHWNTDNPHTHVVLRGKDELGKDLIIARDYIAYGMRQRASALATEWLGLRTELEIRQALGREVNQDRWTGLDRTLQREAIEGKITPTVLAQPRLQTQRQLLVGRLQHLQHMGLATETQPGTWALHHDAEHTLRALGERGDIIRTLQRAMRGQRRELAVFKGGESALPIIGRVAAKGLADELLDKGYLVIDGIDGKAHYLDLPSRTELDHFPIGGVLEARCGVEPTAGPRPADCNIAALAVQGLYRTDQHLALARSQLKPGRDPQETVVTHVRRLEALRRAGIVERVSEGVWYVPADLPARGQQFDVQRSKGIKVVLHSHLTIEQQTHAIGATWLDQQLVGGVTGLGNLGFANDMKLALQHRTEFLVELGLAKHQHGQLVLDSDLLGSLRNRELEKAAQEIAAETHLTYRLPNAEQRVEGIYRSSIQLASGRYAVLDDGQSFSLVPWRPELEVRLGQKVAALVRGSSASYELHRTRNLNL